MREVQLDHAEACRDRSLGRRDELVADRLDLGDGQRVGCWTIRAVAPGTGTDGLPAARIQRHEGVRGRVEGAVARRLDPGVCELDAGHGPVLLHELRQWPQRRDVLVPSRCRGSWA